MRHWLQLATRNWSARPFRAAAVVVAILLGVATVLAVVSVYESVEYAITEQVVDNWVGRSHLNVQTPIGHWGNIDPRMVDAVRSQPNVAQVTIRFDTPMRVRIPDAVAAVPADRYRVDARMIEVNAIGVDPANEYDFRALRELEGRQLAPGDTGVAVMDRQLARDLGLQVGDPIAIEPFIGDAPQEFTIVGTYAAARVAMFQRPGIYLPIEDVNRLRKTRDAVTVIDAIVHDASPEALEATAEALRGVVRERRWNYEVTSATAKLTQLRSAQELTRLTLVLFSVLALLTSFFIIVTTMSMGMMERIRLLGTMRCVGVTRGQIAALVLAEVMPLGALGVILGIPAGMGLTYLGVAFLPYVDQYVQDVHFGRWGISVAVLGGLLTTLAAAGVVLIQALGVSPLRATTPEARGSRLVAVAVAAVVALVLFGVHQWMVTELPPLAWIEPIVALLGMGCLYAAYVLLAPAAVLVVSSVALLALAPLLGIGRKLLRDQVGRAPWRSAGVCWMLMVGLSLMVFFVVRGESFIHAWDFPSKMAGAFVWSERPFDARLIEKVRALPEVTAVTPINDLLCSVKSRQESILSMFKSKSVFVAGDPDTFLAMAQLEFIAGTEREAREKLARGGAVLLPEEAAYAFGYGLGDKVPVNIGAVTAELEVAGVVRSPAMDIAVSFFRADTYMMIASASAVLGTLNDLATIFHVHDHTMYLLDVEPAGGEPPPFFQQPGRPQVSDAELARLALEWSASIPGESDRRAAFHAAFARLGSGEAQALDFDSRREHRRYREALYQAAQNWEELTPADRWQIFSEGLVLGKVKQITERPGAMTGSVRRLKQQIDRDIRSAMLVASAIPLVSLIVASIGVGNLMMVNVASRARHIATLRAVGATKSQIARMVIGEAMVLGVLGCVVGILLGFHMAHSDGLVWTRCFGIAFPWVVPWPRVILAGGITWLICVLAGIGPALRAARSNVIDALQTA